MWWEGKHTAGEESIFGKDCYRVDEEDRDCEKTEMLVGLLY
jgi:hypothetical protein